MRIVLGLLGVSVFFSGCMVTRFKEEAEGNKVFVPGVSRSSLVHSTRESIPSTRTTAQVFLCQSSDKNNQTLCERIAQQESLLSDIPVPLVVTPVSLWENPQGSIILTYRTELMCSVLKDFYVQEMERMGWAQSASFQSDELLLMFKKPHKTLCIVEIRESSSGWKKAKRELRLSVAKK